MSFFSRLLAPCYLAECTTRLLVVVLRRRGRPDSYFCSAEHRATYETRRDSAAKRARRQAAWAVGEVLPGDEGSPAPLHLDIHGDVPLRRSPTLSPNVWQGDEGVGELAVPHVLRPGHWGDHDPLATLRRAVQAARGRPGVPYRLTLRELHAIKRDPARHAALFRYLIAEAQIEELGD